MNIDSRKILLAKEVLNLEDEKIIQIFEKLLKEVKLSNYESSLKPISLEQYKSEIHLAIQDEKAGRMIKATDLKKQIRGWN
ncbi:MAG: hypothetical protein M9897_06845 [Brumimicrobium sp.]|nr:hypothetical protein [Brumimicrobium sp.]